MFGTLDILLFALSRTGWRRFVGTSLLFYAQIVGTEFVLGLTHSLYSYSLALVNIAIAAAIFMTLRKKYGPKLFRNYLESFSRVPNAVKSCAREDPLLATLYVIAGAFLVWVLFIGLIFPPVDWDGNAYHLTYSADLVQNHNLYDVPTNLVWIPAYPKGGEFIQAWTILLAHNDTIVDLVQVPFVIVAVTALYGIACGVGVSKKSARYAALLFAFTPSVLNQLTTDYVDVMVAATFFAALALVLQKTYKRLDFLLVGIAFSLLTALKTSGIYFVAVLLVILLWNLYKQERFEFKKYVTPTLLVLPPMVFGLYWYVKDFILYGSPIYPFGLQLAGKTIFKGIDFAQWSSVAYASLPHNQFLRLWFIWSEGGSNFHYDYDSTLFGFGIIWFIVFIPSLPLSAYFAVRKRNYYFLGLQALLLGLLLVYPNDYSPRYTMFILSAGIVGLGMVLDNLHAITIRATKTILLALTIVTLSVNFILWSYRPNTVRQQLSNIYHGRGEHYSSSIFATSFGSAYTFMHSTVQKNQTVVYTAGNWMYPLWNADFSDRVVYVNATTENSWYKQVMQQKATFVFTTTDTKIKENRWAKNTFKDVVYNDGWYEIFKVN